MFARIRSSRGVGFIGELFMLVLGINIALWAEGRFEDYRDQQTEADYLHAMARDLRTDKANLEKILAANEAKIERLSAIMPELEAVGDKSAEKVSAILFEPSSYTFFTPEDFSFRSMRESGDFQLLSSSEIKENILRLNRLHRDVDTLQDNFIQAMDDGYIPLMMANLDLMTMQLADPALGEKVVFRNFFAYTLQDTSTRIAFCKEIAKQTDELIRLIESETGSSAEAAETATS